MRTCGGVNSSVINYLIHGEIFTFIFLNNKSYRLISCWRVPPLQLKDAKSSKEWITQVKKLF